MLLRMLYVEPSRGMSNNCPVGCFRMTMEVEMVFLGLGVSENDRGGVADGGFLLLLIDPLSLRQC